MAKNIESREFLVFAAALLTASLALFAIVQPTSGRATMQCLVPPDPCLGGGGGPVDQTGNNAPDCSPIIIDVSGDGFRLTSAEQGVQFDISGTGKPVQVAWTAPDSLNAFLVLDRNHDGTISSGAELFGNFSPQPASPNPNGFLALAEFDDATNGGNGDGLIDQRDAVFEDLRLWIDKNHDGISQANELFKLQDLGVFSISLRYKETRRTDRYGNVFRYRARINVTDQQQDLSPASPVAYDVFLTTGN